MMPVGAEQVFEKVHSIPAYDCKSLFAVTIGLPRTEGFDLAQNRAHFARANRGNDPPVANSMALNAWTVEELDACFVVRDHNRQR